MYTYPQLQSPASVSCCGHSTSISTLAYDMVLTLVLHRSNKEGCIGCIGGCGCLAIAGMFPPLAFGCALQHAVRGSLRMTSRSSAVIPDPTGWRACVPTATPGSKRAQRRASLRRAAATSQVFSLTHSQNNARGPTSSLRLFNAAGVVAKYIPSDSTTSQRHNETDPPHRLLLITHMIQDADVDGLWVQRF